MATTHRQPLHALLDGDAVTDLLLWRRRNASAAAMAGATLVWFLFEHAGYSLASVLSNALLLVVILFFWAKSVSLLNRHSTDREVALVMLMSYLSYMLAELLDLSGILTVFFCGIVMSHYTWHNVTESSRVTTKSSLARSSSPATAGSHDRLLNGQVPATSSVNDDVDQMFYWSPIHSIDTKSDAGLHSSKVGVQELQEKNPKENPHPTMF